MIITDKQVILFMVWVGLVVCAGLALGLGHVQLARVLGWVILGYTVYLGALGVIAGLRRLTHIP
jgi:hypothetical protein